MKKELVNSVIYQVYTRNFTPEGTFNSASERLDYIKSLGTNIVYFLPVSPIGENGRKGDLGSPYSISDYMKINPELGTLDDFKKLIKATHEKDMKIMIDIVFNHTSRDSFIVKNQPEWMYKNKEGKFANKAGDWSDVYDLDLTNPDLINYLVSVIEYYCSLGVDGFRFDVASLLPKTFYIALKKMLNEKYPDTILLAESCHPQFILYLRSAGLPCLSDNDLFEVGFDILYMYDCHEYFRLYFADNDISKLDQFKVALSNEFSAFPLDGLRIRGYENHDTGRIIELTNDRKKMRSIAALFNFLKGPMFIYNGFETKADHHPSLFTKDLVDMTIDEEWFNFVKKLADLKKEPSFAAIRVSVPSLQAGEYVLISNFLDNGEIELGYFPFKEELIVKDEMLIDGTYIDRLSNKEIVIKDKTIKSDEPLYLRRIK